MSGTCPERVRPRGDARERREARHTRPVQTGTTSANRAPVSRSASSHSRAAAAWSRPGRGTRRAGRPGHPEPAARAEVRAVRRRRVGRREQQRLGAGLDPLRRRDRDHDPERRPPRGAAAEPGAGRLQVGAGVPGVRHRAHQGPAAVLRDPGQVRGHQHVGELGLGVGAERAPPAPGPLQVGEVDPAGRRHAARHRRDPRRRRGSSSGSSRTVSANGPRKLLPSCSSKPSTVSNRSGGAITPALLTRVSTGRPSATRPSTSSPTDARSARSTRRTSSLAPGTRRGSRPGRPRPSPACGRPSRRRRRRRRAGRRPPCRCRCSRR